jgi:hypothetical protein
VISLACGVLLGTQTGREVSIINTFELLLSKPAASGSASGSGSGGAVDVNMEAPDVGSSSSSELKPAGKDMVKIDSDFLEKRRGQCECLCFIHTRRLDRKAETR